MSNETKFDDDSNGMSMMSYKRLSMTADTSP